MKNPTAMVDSGLRELLIYLLLINQIQKQMEASYFLFNNSSDDTLDLLKQFLPEIEQQLRDQIQPVLVQQFAQQTQEDLRQIEQQAEQQYNDAVQTLEAEFQHLKTQKQNELLAQLNHFQAKLEDHQQRRLIAAQEKFIQENFDYRILNHQKLQQLSDLIENEIGQALLQKYDTLREKKMKELRVRLQNREQKDRKQMDSAIKQQIYAKSGLQQLREEVKEFKISLGSLKSKFNIKINSLTKQTQQIHRKCKEVQYPNCDQLIVDLQQQIAALKSKQASEEASFRKDQSRNMIRRQAQKDEEKTTDNVSRHKVFSLINQPFANYPETQFLQEDIDLDSDDQILSDSEPRQEQSEHEIPMPPSHQNMLQQLLSEQPEPECRSSEESIYLQVPKKPLLRFNIAQMLREQWEEDELDRYLYGEKENKCEVNTTEATSNFSSLYKQHLERLNQGSKPKMRKLSEKAKQHILLSLSSQRQKRQQITVNT